MSGSPPVASGAGKAAEQMEHPTDDSETQVSFARADDILEFLTDFMEEQAQRSGMKRLLHGFQNRLFNWGQRNSLWFLELGIMCCALEMGAAIGPRFDLHRFGIVPRSSPRQCDVMIINGPISYKLRDGLLRLYEQMPEPKWVICMGECSISGGPYHRSYSIVKGARTFLPVDVYIPGCPVRPEALIDGFLLLQRKIESNRRKQVIVKE